MEDISRSVTKCRICKVANLEVVIDFGEMALTGVFASNGKEVPRAPLILMRCKECGLVQLAHSYDLDRLYGESYGYESHLNQSMISHLHSKARILEEKYLSFDKPIILDIASNDGTFLAGFSRNDLIKVGIDPLIEVVSNCYPQDTLKIADFFSKEIYFANMNEQCQLVTSMSVLYDLDDPRKFVSDIADILAEEGIWHFEQSYLPTMVQTLSYDTVCHEHLLYLSLHDISKLLTDSGLQILEVSLNSTNGGSIAVTAIKTKKTISMHPFVKFLLDKEIEEGYQNGDKLREFANRAELHRTALLKLLRDLKISGSKIVGLGASTKGNVLLQWLQLDEDLLERIGDVNSRKFNKRTPGSDILIVDEKEIIDGANEKTIAVVLPWHFRDGIIIRSEALLAKGGSLLFPHPGIEIVSN